MVGNHDQQVSVVKIEPAALIVQGGVAYDEKHAAGQLERDEAAGLVFAELPSATEPGGLEKHGAECLRLWGQIDDQLIWHQEAYTQAKALATIMVRDNYPALGPNDRRPLVEAALASIRADGDRLEMLSKHLDERVKWCKKMLTKLEEQLRSH